jgi:hypothetical protein
MYNSSNTSMLFRYILFIYSSRSLSSRRLLFYCFRVVIEPVSESIFCLSNPDYLDSLLNRALLSLLKGSLLLVFGDDRQLSSPSTRRIKLIINRFICGNCIQSCHSDNSLPSGMLTSFCNASWTCAAFLPPVISNRLKHYRFNSINLQPSSVICLSTTASSLK